MLNILINTEQNQSEEKLIEQLQKKKIIMNESLHVQVWSKPVNCKGYY